MNIDDIPTIEKIKDAIRRINLKTLPTYTDGEDIDEYVKKIHDLITNEFGFGINIKQPSKTEKFLPTFFRARELDTFTDTRLIREHSYPPIDKVTMGRCNFPNKPVFYCSNDAMTALIEVVKNYNGSDKKYCLSKWELIKTDSDLIFESFLNSKLPEENIFREIGKGIQKRISEPFTISLQEKLSKEQEEGLVEYLKFFDESFLNDKNYSLSASIAHEALYANHNYRTDVLMYPSVQTQFKGVNLAMNPNFVENNLRMTRVYIVQLEKYKPDSGSVSVTFTKYADVKKNMIIWKNIDPEDKEYEKFIKQDIGNPIDNEFKKNNLP